MALTISAEHPHIAEGTELGVAGALAVPNGGSVEVTEDQERDFIALRGMTMKDAFEGSEVFSVEGEPTYSDISDVLPEESVRAIRETDPRSLGIRAEDETLDPEAAREVLHESDEEVDTPNLTYPADENMGGEQ